MIPQLYTTNTSFLFRDGGKDLGRAPFYSLELFPEDGVSAETISDMQYYLDEYVPGELFKIPQSADPIVLGRERDYTHEVTLRACGNPDYNQYADIGPKKTVRVCGIEEACKVVRAYQERYEMGGGNCAKEHGVVYELRPPKRRKKIGEVTYGGRFWTVVEKKAFEEELKAKYGPKK